jgi:Ca2+-transporting ATPase
MLVAALFVGMAVHHSPLEHILQADSFKTSFSLLANLGVIFLLFFIGLQIDMNKMKTLGSSITLAMLFNAVGPFVLGSTLMCIMGYDWVLSLIMGIALMPTAEAVIVPLLDRFGLTGTRTGRYIIGVGVLDDVIEVMMVIAASLWIGEHAGETLSKSSMLTETLLHLGLFFLLVYILRQWIVIPLLHKWGEDKANLMLLTVVVLFGLGGIAEMIGLGVVIGAIMAGIVMQPAFGLLSTQGDLLRETIRTFSYSFWGILFFLWIGMSVDVGGIVHYPLLATGLFAAAVLGKIVGIFLLVPMGRLKPKEALLVGIGLNARLTTEIIVAKLLLDAHLIDEKIFTALVAVSSLSTIMIPLLFAALAKLWGDSLKKEAQ